MPWAFLRGRLMGVPNPSARTSSVQTGSYAKRIKAMSFTTLFIQKLRSCCGAFLNYTAAGMGGQYHWL